MRTTRAVLASLAVAMLACAATAEPRHGVSAFGDLKYAAGFTHFDYVNPDAPKGGRLAHIGPAARNTFDSFNNFILRGVPAQGLELVFDTLMVRAFDEPDALYGLVAETIDLAPDRRSAVFKLRAQARFADGTPVTAEDVAFSFRTIKEKGHPNLRTALRDVSTVTVLDPLTVKFDFSGDLLRDPPLAVAALPVLSQAYYATREFDQTTLEGPLGSGPYRIASHNPGIAVTYRRREDYWARDLPVNRGRYNFDEVRFEYFRERAIALEQVKAGAYDLREEFTARDWVQAYDVAAVREGRLLKVELPDKSPSGAQGFFLNTRRDKLKDARVRKALSLAYDFEWANRNLFNGLYIRTHSYFENSDLKAEGLPAPGELALLEPFREAVPPEVFGEPVTPPVTDGSNRDRRLLSEATKLLAAAGYERRGAALANARGEALEVEFLTQDVSIDRIINPYIETLTLLGIKATIRRIDDAQYQERLKTFDFDIAVQRYSLRLTPGAEMYAFWGSGAADTTGSFNIAGIKSPAIDALIGRVLGATSREELRTAARALDRVLRAGHYWVPHWYKASHHVVHWDRFGRPAKKPDYDRGFVDTWWFDAEKAARLRN